MYKKETDTHCDSTSVQISSVEHLRKRNKIRERRAGIQSWAIHQQLVRI